LYFSFCYPFFIAPENISETPQALDDGDSVEAMEETTSKKSQQLSLEDSSSSEELAIESGSE